MIQTGALSDVSVAMSVTTSPLWIFNRSARAGLISAALSHVSFVNGLGSSCNQPLWANRPSQMLGSGRKIISYPAGGGVTGDCRSVWLAVTATVGLAVLGITPLRS